MANIVLGIITAMKKNKARRERKQINGSRSSDRKVRAGLWGRHLCMRDTEGRECESWRTEKRDKFGQDKGCGAETSFSLRAQKCKAASMVRAE